MMAYPATPGKNPQMTAPQYMAKAIVRPYGALVVAA